MIRPTGTDAISCRHSYLDRCLRAEPSEYMTSRVQAVELAAKGTRSSVAGTDVSLGAGLVLVAEDADRVGGRLGAALQAQLGEQRGHVVLHRLLGQGHPLP